MKFKKTIATFLFTILAISIFAHEGSNNSHEVITLPKGIDEFPNYHPLVVHFPIVLLILAASLQLVCLFKNSRTLNIVTLVLIVIGFIGAFVSAYVIHPHTIPLSLEASSVLKAHEQFAVYTVWLSGIATIIKATTFFKRKIFLEVITLLLMTATSITISIAGHHGAELVHKYDIGPKGNYLEHAHEH